MALGSSFQYFALCILPESINSRSFSANATILSFLSKIIHLPPYLIHSSLFMSRSASGRSHVQSISFTSCIIYTSPCRVISLKTDDCIKSLSPFYPPRALPRLHVRADLPRREFEHEPAPGRVLDDRAGDRVRDARRQ